MAKIEVFLVLCLGFLVCSLGFKLRENEREDYQENEEPLIEDEISDTPGEMLLKRGIIPDMNEDDEAYSGTAFLLDAVIADAATVQGGRVEFRFGSGKKAECVNGEKELRPQCRWTGQVTWPGENKPKETKLTVMTKYCKQASLKKPKPKVVSC